jgi:hypothetical protein
MIGAADVADILCPSSCPLKRSYLGNWMFSSVGEKLGRHLFSWVTQKEQISATVDFSPLLQILPTKTHFNILSSSMPK